MYYSNYGYPYGGNNSYPYQGQNNNSWGAAFAFILVIMSLVEVSNGTVFNDTAPISESIFNASE